MVPGIDKNEGIDKRDDANGTDGTDGTRDSDEALAELDILDRGFVLAALTFAGADAPSVASGLTEPAASRCRAALAAIAARDRAERVRVMGRLARQVLARVPEGIEQVHPARLGALLEAESSDTIRIVAAAPLPSLRAAANAVLTARGEPIEPSEPAIAPDLAEELLRAVLAPIVSVPSLPPGVVPARDALRLLAATPASILLEVNATGAAQLGERLGREDPDLAAAVADRLPPALAAQLLDAAARARPSPRDAIAAPPSKAVPPSVTAPPLTSTSGPD